MTTSLQTFLPLNKRAIAQKWNQWKNVFLFIELKLINALDEEWMAKKKKKKDIVSSSNTFKQPGQKI